MYQEIKSKSKQVYFQKQDVDEINNILLSTHEADMYDLHIRIFFIEKNNALLVTRLTMLQIV